MANARKRSGADEHQDALNPSATPIKTPLAFEEAIHRLEEHVTRLEAGQLPLDEALTLFEEGVRLAQHCEAILESAQLRIERLRMVTDDTEQDEAVAAFTVESFSLDSDR